MATCSRDPSELLSCPFDPNHFVSAIRLPNHLIKCSKNYDGEFYTCPFNERHVFISESKMKIHRTECPDRFFVEREMMHETGLMPVYSGDLSCPESFSHLVVPSNGEDWDAEIENEGLVTVPAPDENQKPDKSLLNLSELTSAQKKNYKRGLKREEKKGKSEGTGSGSVPGQPYFVYGIGRGITAARRPAFGFGGATSLALNDKEIEKKRVIRKYQKQLNEISTLEAKLKKGDKLEKNQLEKIIRKEEIEAALQACQ